MEPSQLNWIANYIWGIADDVLRDLYVRGKYRDVILPMTVLRRLDAVLEPETCEVGAPHRAEHLNRQSSRGQSHCGLEPPRVDCTWWKRAHSLGMQRGTGCRLRASRPPPTRKSSER